MRSTSLRTAELINAAAACLYAAVSTAAVCLFQLQHLSRSIYSHQLVTVTAAPAD
jgi:hypothetical protein